MTTVTSESAFTDAQSNNDISRNVRQYKDLDLFFGKTQGSTDISKITDVEAVKRSVRNLVLTWMGERPFQPKTGSRLRQLLFEPYDVFLAQDIKEEIINVVKRLEPRINVRQVRVFNHPEDENNLRVEFDYTIVGETLIQTVDFLLETI